MCEPGALKLIYTKEDRLAYIDKQDLSPYTPVPIWTPEENALRGEEPSYGKDEKSKTSIKAEEEQNSKVDANAEPETKPLFPKVTRPNQESRRRKRFIPSGCSIKINNPKINSLFKELKDIEHSRFLYATVVLFRVFLECSVKEYISKKNLKGNEDSKLGQDIDIVSKYFEDEAVMTKHELQPIRKMTSDPNCFFSTRTFNAYVHNPHAIVTSAQELNNVWDTLELFIRKLWE